jgi:hypothetical protein
MSIKKYFNIFFFLFLLLSLAWSEYYYEDLKVMRYNQIDYYLLFPAFIISAYLTNQVRNQPVKLLVWWKKAYIYCGVFIFIYFITSGLLRVTLPVLAHSISTKAPITLTRQVKRKGYEYYSDSCEGAVSILPMYFFNLHSDHLCGLISYNDWIKLKPNTVLKIHGLSSFFGITYTDYELVELNKQ